MYDSFDSSRNTRRLLLKAGALTLLGAAGLGARAAQPVRMVIPFTPGTTPDLIARLLGPKLQASLGQPFVADNKPGASGMLGMDAVAKAPADGSTLLFGTSTALTLPFVYRKVPFDVLTAFTPITMIGTTNFALVVHPSVPAKNARELVAWVKSQPAPVDYASPGKGTFQHLTMEWIAHLAGMDLRHVPYRGSAPAVTDLLGGHVKLLIMPLHVAAPLAADNKLRILGATRRTQDAAYPTVPPLHQSGVPNLDADAWYAVWGPKGMSRDLVGRYNTAIRAVLNEPDSKATLEKQGVSVQTGTPEELARIAQAEHDKWGRLIKDIKLPQEE
ncbi:Bug family tripartite tricarboxylate transporter substrate binding protein [Caldimonas tepidiphila]|uniref:Bug family tripartite tricarboxylate transporter substrate binding protein n=1 Tax=Caldimonas tepidiphila TaxID=2315841 RepID=UPI0013006183|nr:tripartite tricarboxylate transporter substrate binding protein [Caldimonas tepidiphila]